MKKYKLSDLFDLQMGKTPARNNPKYWEEGTNPWISIADMSSNGKYITTTKECITDRAISDTGIRPIFPGTVIMSFKLSIGKVARTTVKSYSNEAIMAFEIKDREPSQYTIDNDYAYYLLSALNFENIGNKAVMGKTLNKAILENTEVYVHLWDEQRRIISKLDKVIELIELRTQQLSKLDELVKSQFIEMFGSTILNPFGWKKDNLGAVCDVRDGTHDSPQYYETGYPLVTSKNVTGGKIDLTDCSLICEADYKKINERSKVDMGDIIMPMIGTVGKPVIVDIEPSFAIKNVSLIKFEADSRVLNIYIRALLQSDYFDDAILSKVRGGTQKFISLGDIRKLEVLVPPMELQEQFAVFVEQIDKLKLAIQKSLNQLETLKKSLMQKYFG